MTRAKRRRYLYIEDDPDYISDAKKDLQPFGVDVHGVSTGEEGLALLQRSEPDEIPRWDALFLDLNLEEGGGLLQGEDVLEALVAREDLQPLPVLVLTSYSSYAKMLSLEKRFGGGGGTARPRVLYDYVIKGYIGREQNLPSHSYGALLALAAERVVALFQLERSKKKEPHVQVPPALVGVSRPIVNTYQKLRAFARLCTRADAPSVLITGESGTGKEVAARLLHHLSPRSSRPVVAINCACFPEMLLESELFGYEKGAFTGADKAKKGLIRQAEGGTVFLDEIGEMPLALQAKLLRVLEQQTVRPVGGDKEATVNVRFVAATNRQLLEQVKQGRFREDLYYRIASLTLQMPPLRDRKEDIAPLFRTFVRQKMRLLPELSDVTPGPKIEEYLEQHTFPGNVRELSNIVERALAASLMREDTAEPVITLEDIKKALEQDTVPGTGALPTLAESAKGAMEAFADHLFAKHVEDGATRKPKEIAEEWLALSLEIQILLAVQRWKRRQGEKKCKPTLEELKRWFGWNTRESYRKALAKLPSDEKPV